MFSEEARIAFGKEELGVKVMCKRVGREHSRGQTHVSGTVEKFFSL